MTRYIRHAIAGLLLAFAVAPAAHCQNLDVEPEMQYRLSPSNAARLDRVLPPLPDSVPTALGWYHVTYPRDATCGLKLPQPGMLLGCTDIDAKKIQVTSAEPSRAQRWMILKHEMAHIMFYDTHITFASGVLEERACDVVATWSLMEYLTARLP